MKKKIEEQRFLVMITLGTFIWLGAIFTIGGLEAPVYPMVFRSLHTFYEGLWFILIGLTNFLESSIEIFDFFLMLLIGSGILLFINKLYLTPLKKARFRKLFDGN